MYFWYSFGVWCYHWLRTDFLHLSNVSMVDIENGISESDKTCTGKIAFFDNFSCENSSMQNKLTEVAMKITSPDFLNNDNHFWISQNELYFDKTYIGNLLRRSEQKLNCYFYAEFYHK